LKKIRAIYFKDMKVPFLDLKIKNKIEQKKLIQCMKRIFVHGKFIEGPEVSQFESKMGFYLKKRYAVGLSSGSSALYLSLKSLGIGPGDEVITTPFTWIITVNAILETGAKPIFADIKEDFNIDPKSIENSITKKTKAIVPMHVGGHMCEMFEINKIANKNKIYVVEDAAQAVCGSLRGKKAGYFSDIAAFSMNPMKMLNALGETGLITTNNKKLYEKVLMLRHAGTRKDPKKIDINNCYIGSLNHKIDTIQASFLLSNFNNLEAKRKKRDKFAKIYDQELGKIVNTQKYHKGEIHGRYLYIFSCSKRNKLLSYLRKHKIECKVFYSPLASDAPIFQNKKNKIQIKNARRLLKESLSIPLHEKLSYSQINYIIDNIKRFYKNEKKII